MPTIIQVLFYAIKKYNIDTINEPSKAKNSFDIIVDVLTQVRQYVNFEQRNKLNEQQYQPSSD